MDNENNENNEDVWRNAIEEIREDKRTQDNLLFEALQAISDNVHLSDPADPLIVAIKRIVTTRGKVTGLCPDDIDAFRGAIEAGYIAGRIAERNKRDDE